MMSEDIHKWTRGRYVLMFDEHTFFVWDNEKEERMCALEVTKKLNEQQSTIDHLKQELGEYKENWDDMVELATKTSLRNVELDEQIGRLQREKLGGNY